MIPQSARWLRAFRWALAAAAGIVCARVALADPPQMPADGVAKQLDRRGGGRVPFSPDEIALAMARGEFAVPQAGVDGWEAVSREEDVSFRVRGGAYAAFVVQAEEPRTMLLKASGHGMVYVNGEPRAGDPYGYGFVHLPVRLHAGENVFLFQHGRGALRAELIEPPAEVFFLEGDVTSPDFLHGRDETLPLGAVVVNATEEAITAVPWARSGEDEGEHARIEGAAMTVPAMSVRKVVFPVHYDGRDGETMKITLGFGEHETARREIELAIRKPGQMYKRTFLSRIDGSVQYYAVQPRIPSGTAAASGTASPGAEPSRRGAAQEKPWSEADPSGDRTKTSPRSQTRSGEAVPLDRPALVLSLHGASVEATNQAAAYAPKTWCDIVCPTNRRPFGFDWEEWGRIDAIEALDDAMRHLNSDPSRVYLTGHSMGGHGTWSVAAHHPDRFAAIGASAGWLSFGSYTGAGHPQLFEKTDGVAGIFARATRAADTALLLPNLRGKGIYILHGEADDNVPVREAREMAEKLRELGIPFEYHEQPRAGHWWESSDEPGAECVDWPAMFDLFARHRLAGEGEVRNVEFVTTNVGGTARKEWATVYQQIEPGLPSRLLLQLDPMSRRVEGTTDNVRLLTLDPNVLPAWPSQNAATRRAEVVVDRVGPDPGPPREFEKVILNDTVAVDGERLAVPLMFGRYPLLVLHHDERGWHGPQQHQCDLPPDLMLWGQQKHPSRAGPFKHAFDNGVVFVYGTKGTPEETAWARAKARYDAESFWYRGNGSIAVVADVDYDPQEDQRVTPDHSVILYGNADTHEDWGALLKDCPIELSRGEVKIGDYFAAEGEDRGIVFCWPRPGSEKSLVGVVGGTGLVGMRLTDRLPYFTSGVHYPDWTVFGPAIYENGYESADAAGYFDNGWKVDAVNSARREAD